VAFDLPKFQINEEEVASFLRRADESREDDFVMLESTINPCLFLYAFYNYRVYFSKLNFRGSADSHSKKIGFYLFKSSLKFFPKSFPLDKMEKAFLQLFDKNERFEIGVKKNKINEFAEDLRKEKKFYRDKRVAEYFQILFDYKLILTKDEFAKLKKDLCSWKMPSDDDYHKHILKSGDIKLDDSVALKFSHALNKKDKQEKKNRLLFKQIWKDFFLAQEEIEPMHAKIIRYLFDLSNAKFGEYHYGQIAKKLGSKSARVITQSIKEINDIAKKHGYQPIIIEGNADGEKILNPCLDCVRSNLHHSEN